MICKHYGTPQGCSYGDKCQFAHGQKELRTNNMQGFPAIQMANAGKAQNNIINYKIVKCKNFEKMEHVNMDSIVHSLMEIKILEINLKICSRQVTK